MRCPDCNKFVSFETDSDPEIDVHVDDEGNLTGTVRITNNCSECSQELKEATFDIEASVSEDVLSHRENEGWNGKGSYPDGHGHLSVTDNGGTRTDRMQDKDRRGRTIKNSRYMKHLYGAEAEFVVECECGETWTVSWSDEVQGSGMEEMV